MTLRVCARPGCNARTSGRHCTTHNVNITSVYDHAWRTRIRPAVLARDHHHCRYCGQPGTPANPLAAAHLDETHKLLWRGDNVHDISRIVAAHQSCHNQNAPHLWGAGSRVNADALASPRLGNLGGGSGDSVATGVFYSGAG